MFANCETCKRDEKDQSDDGQAGGRAMDVVCLSRSCVGLLWVMDVVLRFQSIALLGHTSPNGANSEVRHQGRLYY